MISVEDGDVPFDDRKILSHSAGAIEGTESDALIFELFNTPVFKEAAEKACLKIYPGSSFRHIAVQTGQGESAVILSLPHDHIGEKLGQYLPRGSDNAAVLEHLMRLAHEILNKHPINIKRRAEGKLPGNGIWFWAEGTAVELPDFTDKYGKKGSVISAVPLCQGIGVLIGLEKVYVNGATGMLNTNYEGKMDAALEALKTRDFAVIHVEAPDECTHNGDIAGKLQAIEWIDSRIVAPLLLRLKDNGTDFRLLLISDHRTLLSTRGHDGGPVPYIIYDNRFNNKSGLNFNETDAAKGEYIEDGTKLMSLLFESTVL